MMWIIRQNLWISKVAGIFPTQGRKVTKLNVLGWKRRLDPCWVHSQECELNSFNTLTTDE